MELKHTKDPEEVKPPENQFSKTFFDSRLKIIITCLLFVLCVDIFRIHNMTQINSHIITTNNNHSGKNEIDKLPENMKYILLWSSTNSPPFDYLKTKQNAFIDQSCEYKNCYVTEDRNFLPNITQFQAIAFNGNLALKKLQKEHLPQIRSSHQKYIYFNAESSSNYPVCQPYFDNFFNWTASYKLKSDLVMTYFQVIDNKRHVVAPKLKPDWIPYENMFKVNPNVTDFTKSKSRAAAWLVSNCRGRRMGYVQSLKKELSLYNLTVDMYGRCGPRKKKDIDTSMASLEKKYYFYLAFENSFAEDYVTEKVLKGLENFIVPIVYGGASIDRFLPPHSYINADNYSTKDLARLMSRLMKSPQLYMEYFRWKSHYRYRYSLDNTCVCSLCEALNDKHKMKYSSYPKFRHWWYPYYKNLCGNSTPKSLISWLKRG